MSAGTIQLTNNSTAVTGTGTAFMTDVQTGDFITATIGGVLYTMPVDTVTSNTAATLVSPYTGPTTTGAAWAAVPRKVLNQVTADLVAQSTEALRGLMAEKAVWTDFYTAPEDISVRLTPDMPSVSGPGWKKMAGLVSSSQQWRGNLPGAANLNAFGPTPDFTGIWNRSSNTNTIAAYGFPEDNGQGILEVFAGGRYGGMQRYTVSINGNVYVRSLTGAWNGADGPWGEWSLCGVNTRPGIYSGDLNLLVTPGVWSVGDSNSGTTNAPSVFGQTTSNGICEVILRNAGNTVLQRFTTMTSSATTYNYTWQRTLYGTTWSPWELVGKKALNDLGMGVSSNVLASLDWQNFDFVPGALYVVQSGNMTNVPVGLDVPGATYNTLIRVNGPEGGTRHVEVVYSTTTSANYRYYQVRVAGETGARTFSVRQQFTSTDVVPVANGGTGATTPAGGRTALGLGTAATRNTGQGAGNVPVLGDDAGLPYTAFMRFTSNGTGVFSNAGGNRPGLQVSNLSNNSASSAMMFIRDGIAGILLGLDAADNAFAIGGGTLGNVRYRLWHEGLTTVDANGFIKRASPVVKVYSDGSAELNAESAGVTVERLETGVYRISGVLGFNSDAGWGGVDGGIELPTDKNKLPLVWVDYEVGPDGSILLKTFHRTHPGAPKFARNEINGVADGDPVDIPAGRCIDLRVEMPVNSVWNTEQARLAEEFRAECERQQREAEQQAVAEDSQNQSVTADKEIDS
ncbi:pyocin knob domain-containing protein [Atlantibacter hermannii]|uniref:pyocin knob domain-containing protein n=1 Tax=Atlantibacter hermannii TaxID=565 RepID=UPI00289A8063|nr:pyocin knob domain-containing protein [Atlantibacter hermannii]